MKITFLLIIAIFVLVINLQSQDFNSFLDSGKAEFVKEFEEQDYLKAAYYLEKAVELNPNDAESRYYLAYAYSRINSKDGKSMINIDIPLVLKSSEQLEQVIKLSPKYDGEIIALDPYSKLTSEWGSLAMSYWHNNKVDSAKWAFSEGKKRGGFGNYILSANRKILDACSQNAYLISSGDNFTIPLWYLQIVENYRKDVSVIDVALLNSYWYPNYLAKNNIATFGISTDSLLSIDYIEWLDSAVTINNFTWIVKASYDDKYLLRGDRILLSLLTENSFKREVFFTSGFNENNRLNLGNHIISYILLDKLINIDSQFISDEDFIKSAGNILEISKVLNKNSSDDLQLLDLIRYNILFKVEKYILSSNKANAKILINFIDKFANEIEFPYLSDGMKNYSDYLKLQL